MTRDVSTVDGDSTRERRGPTRRGVLRGAAVSLVAGGTLASLPLGLGQETVPTILLGGRTAGWEGVAPASIADETNPALDLVAGQRYRIIWQNTDGVPHNITIEDADENRLEALEVVEVETGLFDELQTVEEGEAVDNMTVANLTANATAANETAAVGNETNATGDGNVTDGEEAPQLVTVSPQVSERGAVQAVEFVATEEMAVYRCTIHPTTMVGDVIVDGDGM